MTTTQHVSYQEDPQYKLALMHFEKGEWDQGLKILEDLTVRYPLANELRDLKVEMRLRSRIDMDEQEDVQVERRQKIIKFGTRALIGLTVIALTFWGIYFLGAQLESRFQVARQAFAQEVNQVELAVKMRDAQSLLQAGRSEEAYELLEEIQSVDADYPELDSMLERASLAASRASRYNTALELIGQQKYQEARTLLLEIQSEAPAYRDITQLLARIDQQTLYADLQSEAQSYYDQEEWEQAVGAYEELLTLVPEEQLETIEGRLYESYINSARAALMAQSDSISALTVAEEYFRKALTIRPQEPEIKRERDMARLYLEAQSLYNQSRWTQVITNLEFVVATDPGYANGTARQTLYEAYVARGDAKMNDGNYESALSDYERAVSLAQQETEALLRLYESQVKAAEAQGELGNYEAAVLLYKAAADLGGMEEVLGDDPARLNALQEAENFINLGNYAKAYERYRFALHITAGNYCLAPDRYAEALRNTNYAVGMISHIVQPEDYLTSLASRYNSTVCAIVVANEIDDPNVILDGQELLIPVTP